MAANTTEVPKRPQHRRNASSKSNIFRALVSPNIRTGEKETASSAFTQNERTQTVPLLPPDHPHAAKSRVLGERHENSQSSAAASPRKTRSKQTPTSTSNNALVSSHAAPIHTRDASTSPKKSKSSTNLASMLGKVNRPNRDANASAPKDKENTTPPSSSDGPRETPIWAQFATTAKLDSHPNTRSSNSSYDINEEIAKYTPQQYSPSKQRNFDGTFERPQLRPTLASRPQSMYAMGADFVGAIGRRVSGDKTELSGRKSEEVGRRWSKELSRRETGDKTAGMGREPTERKTSGSSAEQVPMKEKLDIAKRGGRVMAAVAAWQGKTKDAPLKSKDEQPLDPQAVEEAFESVLDSRNIPEPMRQKMRSLTLRVKVDFIKQHQGAAAAEGSTSSELAGCVPFQPAASSQAPAPQATDLKEDEDDSKSTKRSRARSRTFTFSKGDKRGDGSPSKKQRSSSKVRSASTHDATNTSPTTPTTPRSSMDKRRSAGPAVPSDFIAYLRDNRDPVNVEVGRLHKLRILLRNETVAWVDSFVSLSGMTEIVGLLHRIMAIEWREEHEDQLLHETLLCLKGLCTTERALGELEKVADTLFPALIGMLFDNEKKGPAEYTTRSIIITVLFNFLAAETSSSPEALEARARRILAYLGEPTKPEEARPVHFVLDMRSPRPYKLWCRELTHVTKEVFWIFLHHLNIIPRPQSRDELVETDSDLDNDAAERAKALKATYTNRHFPTTRPPVPAAPYIGGVEWDATTYLTTHLDLLNGLLASIPHAPARNALRAELRASGFEKILGGTLRTCKEKFYAGLHDGLRAWVAAAEEDGWETRFVREGPTLEEQALAAAAGGGSPRKSPNKKKDAAPKIEVPKIEAPPALDLGALGGGKGGGDDFDDGWLG